MNAHPYKTLDKRAFWRTSVAEPAPGEVDPVGIAKFTLSRTDAVATAGSCFAQHIARHLKGAGFNYLVTETAHPLIPAYIADRYGYGLFTARYANVYTSRQMIQLLERAYGLFVPADDMWAAPGGALIDPFRPQIQPGGFPTREEFEADRAQHFAAVRTAVETLDCLVFTLGLTECWLAREDGAAYPVCPGVSGGAFDEAKHVFHNLTVGEIVADLTRIIEFVLARNPAARFIFTVSPVPLVATASDKHVLTATTYSKSVLRAAAGEVADGRANVAYFPSYEIVTGGYSRGSYFADDLRSVTNDGVAHVMRLFLKHYGAGAGEDDAAAAPAAEAPRPQRSLAELTALVCEEEALQKFA